MAGYRHKQLMTDGCVSAQIDDDRWQGVFKKSGFVKILNVMNCNAQGNVIHFFHCTDISSFH